jgi:hypothetical protein
VDPRTRLEHHQITTVNKLVKSLETYLILIFNLLVLFQVKDQSLELFIFCGTHRDVFLGVHKNSTGLLECLIAIGPVIRYNIFLKGIKAAHIGIHRNDIHQEPLWFKMETFWVLNSEFETSLCGEPLKAEVKSLCKAYTELLRDKWFLAMGGDFGQKLDDHVAQL